MTKISGGNGLLLDTNIVTAYIKGDRRVLNRLRDATRGNQNIFISCITYYEIRRGFIYSNASRRQRVFDALRATVATLLLDDLALLETAAFIHADLRRRGRPIQDADILIAATALLHNLILISDDTDLRNIPTLRLENWLAD